MTKKGVDERRRMDGEKLHLEDLDSGGREKEFEKRSSGLSRIWKKESGCFSGERGKLTRGGVQGRGHLMMIP